MTIYTSRIFWLSLLVLCSFFSIRPLFSHSFFPMHDDTQPTRIYVMAQALKSGQFPVRLVPYLGYGVGYPLFNFYAPLPYYLGTGFYLLGFDLLVATKLMMMVGMLLAGVSMYLFVQKVAGNIAAFASSIFYLYAPYHAVNLYVRGAIGELFAYAFLPIVLLGLYCLHTDEKKKGIVIGSIGFAGILLSHNILGMISLMLFAGGLLVYVCIGLVMLRNNLEFKKQMLHILSMGILGLGLSSFFVLPAFVEKSHTQVEKLTSGGSDFRQHFVYFDQLWDSPWGFAGSAPGRLDGMSFKIGKFHLLFGILGVLAFYFAKRKQLFFFFHIFLLFVSLFFLLSFSEPLWEILPFFPFIQYPWRFLNFTVLSVSFLGSFLFLPFSRKPGQIVLAFILGGTAIFMNAKYFSPQEYRFPEASDYIQKGLYQYLHSKISDEYLPKNFIAPARFEDMEEKSIVANSDLIVLEEASRLLEKEFLVNALQHTTAIINTGFFPGWKVFVDGESYAFSDREGRIGIPLLSGQHRIRLAFTDTPVRTVGNTLSILSFFLLGYVIIVWKGNDHEKTIFS